MIEQISLRQVEKTDTPFLFSLFSSVRGPELDHAGMHSAEKIDFLQTQFKAMHTHYAERFPTATHDIVLHNGKPCGRFYVNESAEEIRLLDIIIEPSKRNAGIGSHLLNSLTSRGDSSGKPVRFYVWHSNTAAQRFYKRHGFTEVRMDGAYLLMERAST